MKNELVFAVVCITYLAVALGLTVLNIFVEMPMVGPAMLMYTPAVLIVGFLVYLGTMLFAKESH